MFIDPLKFYQGSWGHIVKRLGIGQYEIDGFNSDILLYDENNYDLVEGLPIESEGVCDSPEQLMELAGEAIQNDKRSLAVFFTYVSKDPFNRGMGGGWRWHKWGEYVGKGTPTTEYLDDEDEFENGVYVFSISEVKKNLTSGMDVLD
jgi:hypothetical protein